ncbi:ATP-binding protein [uncultured Kordia sp.]|uniref:sensor histidine kinase n=1 Tax=uncultured Kordia sp. TaxID=507699 RepID=UPI00260E514A|nr:ATP-binding protein [uncultured Kordia sp.]
MAIKTYYIQILIRIVIITGIAILLAFLFNKGQYYLSGLCFLFIGIQVVFFVRYLNKTNHKIAYFFESIENEDFTIRFPEDSGPNSLRELHKSLNKVRNFIQETQVRNREQENYYQEILKQVKIGVLTINDKGHILFANPTAKRLFNTSQLNHINQLKKVDKKLSDHLSKLQPFERQLFQITNERETISLVVKAKKVVLNAQMLNLVTIQDINNELNEKETDSWMKLIRVLTHEIMNTITPLSSISESILNYYKTDEGWIAADQINEKQVKNTIRGLEIINNQGNRLIDFVHSYRSLLSIPEPDKKIINIQDFLEEVKTLVSQEKGFDQISFKVRHLSGDFEIFADEKQITQTLINLLKNAMQSSRGKEDSSIELISGINEVNRKFIKVKDNGIGIPSELMEQIFVPFFTTKTDGSGIGLSLSRQILQMHNGSLTVTSVPNKETSFTLLF